MAELSIILKSLTYHFKFIMQEMIQNADDAGAGKIQFFVDRRTHSGSNVLIPELANYQGPALLSANDAMFTDQDWDGIQNLQQSGKAEDPFKVGRFGIGFNSVYHLTGKLLFFFCNYYFLFHFYSLVNLFSLFLLDNCGLWTL